MKPTKISRLIKNLQEILEEHGDLMCVYSIDEEGNAFHPVYWDPTMGRYNMRDHEYLSEDDFKEMLEEGDTYVTSERNEFEKVVCIN